MEQDNVTSFDLDVLLGESVVDLLLVERRTGGNWCFSNHRRYVEDNTPRNEGRQFFDTELLEPVSGCEVDRFVAVVVDVVDADVSEPIKLRTSADPTSDDVVVVGGFCGP